jgi:hypothetical protein
MYIIPRHLYVYIIYIIYFILCVCVCVCVCVHSRDSLLCITELKVSDKTIHSQILKSIEIQ